MFKEKGARSLVKVFTWRFLATVTTMILVYIFVGRIDIAAAVGSLEVVVKMIIYYFHERAWDKIQVGRYRIRPFVLWFTGLPCAGKTTLADRVYDFLKKKELQVERLEGKSIRALFPETDYSRRERNMHTERLGLLAAMLEKNGISVVASFVSPYRESRDLVRKLCQNYIEVYVQASVQVCEGRDKRGLYARARGGELQDFTGVNAPYDAPERPEVTVDTERLTVDQSFQEIKKYITRYIR